RWTSAASCRPRANLRALHEDRTVHARLEPSTGADRRDSPRTDDGDGTNPVGDAAAWTGGVRLDFAFAAADGALFHRRTRCGGQHRTHGGQPDPTDARRPAACRV